MSEVFHIAIDGPVASGKGTVANGLSDRLGIPCLDTGAMYRAFAVYIDSKEIDEKDEQAVAEAIQKFRLDVRVADKTYVGIDGKDVTDKIRTNVISMKSSVLATYPCVRKMMIAQQREIAEAHSFILEGRDISSVVLPDAKYKFFLTAKLKTRAERRFLEHKEKGTETDLKDMVKQIKKRDKNDKTKGALRRVRSAVLIDNTRLTREQTIDVFLAHINVKTENS